MPHAHRAAPLALALLLASCAPPPVRFTGSGGAIQLARIDVTGANEGLAAECKASVHAALERHRIVPVGFGITLEIEIVFLEDGTMLGSLAETTSDLSLRSQTPRRVGYLVDATAVLRDGDRSAKLSASGSAAAGAVGACDRAAERLAIEIATAVHGAAPPDPSIQIKALPSPPR